MKTINILLAILFFAFAVLQYNDPDPYIWMFVYGVSALLCINAALGKKFRLANISLIVFSVIWMVLLVPQLVEWIVGGMPSLASDRKHDSNEVELMREFFGLLITISTMVFHLYTPKVSEKLIENNPAI